jgi:hypothetical protein
MKAIVTVKLKRPWIHHNPRDKKTGRCPLCERKDGKYEYRTCTDTTGSHHSYIEEGENREETYQKAKKKYGHVTRVEVIHDS